MVNENTRKEALDWWKKQELLDKAIYLNSYFIGLIGQTTVKNINEKVITGRMIEHIYIEEKLSAL